MSLRKYKCDNIAIVISVIYVVLPIIIFLWGWLRFPFALAGTILLVLLSYELYEECTKNEVILLCKNNIKYWCGTGLICAIWVYLSGIGSFAYQNWDHMARNPTFRDLSIYNYPVIYNLSQQSEFVQEICGNGHVALSYYFTWWLPAASISNLFDLAELIRNVLLYSWALVGILMIVYLLNRKLGKCSWKVPVVLIFFSGLDAIPWILFNTRLPITDHLESWASFFQYSSNTTQLFWVFNQSIPIWLIVSLLLQLEDNKYIAGLCSLSFAYSPWATFGMVPIAIGGSFRQKEKIKNIFSPVNILVPLMMLAVYGTFYMASSGSTGGVGVISIFSLYPDSTKRLLCSYLVFLFIEFGIYFILLGDKAEEYKFYYIVLGELIIFPTFIIRDGNFIMRGSIPALFLLMFFVIKFLHDGWFDIAVTVKKRLLILVLCIGALTPLAEINRALKLTMKSDSLIFEEIYSFGNIQSENPDYIRLVKDQFFVYEYEDALFFKYLAKK